MKHIAVKELRVGQAWSQNVFEFDSSVKVVVLLRDPRAVVFSRQTGWPPPTKRNDTMALPAGWNGNAGFPYDQSYLSLCMEHQALRLKAQANSDTIMLIEYQEVLRDSMGLANRLFKFLGFEQTPPEVVEHIEKNTKGDCAHVDAPFSVCRKLEKAVDDKWIDKIDPKRLEDLLKVPVCQQVLKRYDQVREDL